MFAGTDSIIPSAFHLHILEKDPNRSESVGRRDDDCRVWADEVRVSDAIVCVHVAALDWDIEQSS